MTRDVHVVTESENDGLDLYSQFPSGGQNQSLSLAQVGVDGLKHWDRKGGGFTRTRLGLGNNISTTDDGDDRTLLDGGRFLKVVSINSAQEIFFQVESLDCIGKSSAFVYKDWLSCTHR